MYVCVCICVCIYIRSLWILTECTLVGAGMFAQVQTPSTGFLHALPREVVVVLRGVCALPTYHPLIGHLPCPRLPRVWDVLREVTVGLVVRASFAVIFIHSFPAGGCTCWASAKRRNQLFKKRSELFMNSSTIHEYEYKYSDFRLFILMSSPDPHYSYS